MVVLFTFAKFDKTCFKWYVGDLKEHVDTAGWLRHQINIQFQCHGDRLMDEKISTAILFMDT